MSVHSTYLPGSFYEEPDVEGSISDLTAEEAKGLAFGGDALACPRDKWRGATVPLLEEVLRFVKDYDASSRTEVKIELKGPDTERPVLELVERLDMVDRCTYISFDHERLRRVRKLRPQRRADGTHAYRTGAVFAQAPADFVEKARDVDATEVHLRYDTCTRTNVEAVRKAGLVSVCWFRGPRAMRDDLRRFRDVDGEDEDLYRMLLLTGVQAVTANRAGRLVDLVADMYEQ